MKVQCRGSDFQPHGAAKRGGGNVFPHNTAPADKRAEAVGDTALPEGGGGALGAKRDQNGANSHMECGGSGRRSRACEGSPARTDRSARQLRLAEPTARRFCQTQLAPKRDGARNMAGCGVTGAVGERAPTISRKRPHKAPASPRAVARAVRTTQ